MDNKKEADILFMKKIENISKRISDLINVGKYENIQNLDKTRLELIKKFNNKNHKHFQTIISQIKANNVQNIERIEIKYKSLQSERSNFVKRLRAYNN